MENKKPTCIMLIGPPASGKSTYAKKFDSLGYQHISTDSFVEAEAARRGKTYMDVWKEVANAAEANMKRQIKAFVSAKQDVIWDQTNMSVKSRASKIAMLKKHGYTVIAVAFEISPAELKRRAAEHKESTGKEIPVWIVRNMMKTYDRPTEGEGFDEVSIIAK